MIQLTALYAHPQDPDAFDRHYREVHAPLARKFPGIKGYTAYKPASLNPQERLPYYLIADLYFDSPEAFSAALNSPEGQAAAADLQNFATAGVTFLAGEVQVYDPISIG